MKEKVFSFIIMLCIVNLMHISAKTYYVSAYKGKDSDRGSLSSPLKSISKASEMAFEGDTIFVFEGIYRERVAPPRGGKPGKPIVYMGEPGKHVFIKGSDIYKGPWKFVKGSFYEVDLNKMNFTDDHYWDSPNPFKVPVSSTPWNRDGKPEGVDNVIFNLGQIFVGGIMYKQIPLLNELALQEGTWWYNKEKNSVVINFIKGHSTNSEVEITTRRRIFAPHLRGLGYIHVIGFVMEHCGNQFPRDFWRVRENAQAGALGLRSGHNWLVKNNIIRYAGNVGIDCGTEGPDNERTNQKMISPHEVKCNVFENNYLLDNGSNGITGYGSYNMIVRNNVVMFNNNQMYRGHKRYEQGGIKFHDNTNSIIEGNYVANNYTYGVWFDNSYYNARISKNIIVNNARSGVFLEMGDYDFGAVLIDYNVIMDNEENQIYMHDASGALVVNNLLAGTKTTEQTDANVHTGVKKREKYGQAVYIRQVGPRCKTYHNSFYNNLFCGNYIDIDVNYPKWRSGEQRFLGNVYDKKVLDKRMVINKTSDVPHPLNSQELLEQVATDLQTPASSILGPSKEVLLNLPEWQAFWSIHSIHNDRDAEIFDGLYASYQLETQTVHLGVRDSIAKRDNKRWNDNYKAKFNLDDDFSYPGPFEDLKVGSHNYSIYQGLPPVKASGELPKMIY